jgi:hypothetical protein
MMRCLTGAWLVGWLCLPVAAMAQSVCLPAPRLLTTMPMGGQVGTSLEITVTGEHIDEPAELNFSHPGLKATRKLDDNGQPVAGRYVVSIAADCPVGIHEARLLTRLGISSSRVFVVGELTEISAGTPHSSVETAQLLTVNSICNAVMTPQSVDYYAFEATKDQRIVVDCAAQGMDSKLKPVLIIADARGADLLVERRGGALDFTVPESGRYVIKVHELTYNGGPAYFYRLALREASAGEVVPRLPSVQSVSSFSWPPANLPAEPATSEIEPNNQYTQSQKITLPCDIAGSFFLAADVDTFEFTAQKGEVWWIEVASERLGRPTDPSIIVQHVGNPGAEEKLTDVVQLSDIPSPVKVSSNGYSYDGPPYNAGSSDILGRLEIQEDGVHRLQLRDLFGGTRNDPRNMYRLVIRKAAPDFALVAWALHMELRNGDRNALSKPIALRQGATMALEVVAVRRDGFDGEIELAMDNLPAGVTATGLKIPAGQSRGILLISADSQAPRGFTCADFLGRATIDGTLVQRPCRLASMQWPVPDASQQIPSPRLLADVPVSVCESELAPLTIAPAEDKVFEVAAGEKLTIPLVHTRRCEFSGATIGLQSWTCGLGNVPAFDARLDADASEVVLDLAALKTAPGDYTIAFYGSAVAKYRYNPQAVTAAEAALQQARQQAEALAAETARLAEAANSATDDQKAGIQQALQDAVAKQKLAEAAVAAADKRLQDATAQAQPKDIVDIVVSRPISIRVHPATTEQ